MNIHICGHPCTQIDAYLSIWYIYSYRPTYPVDRHILTNRYAYISVYIHVFIMNMLWVAPRPILTTWPIDS